jgi:hypothetical protein
VISSAGLHASISQSKPRCAAVTGVLAIAEWLGPSTYVFSQVWHFIGSPPGPRTHTGRRLRSAVVFWVVVIVTASRGPDTQDQGLPKTAVKNEGWVAAGRASSQTSKVVPARSNCTCFCAISQSRTRIAMEPPPTVALSRGPGWLPRAHSPASSSHARTVPQGLSALHGQRSLTCLICTLLCDVEIDQQRSSRVSHACRMLIASLPFRSRIIRLVSIELSTLARERNVCFACLRVDIDLRESCQMWKILSETLSKEVCIDARPQRLYFCCAKTPCPLLGVQMLIRLKICSRSVHSVRVF